MFCRKAQRARFFYANANRAMTATMLSNRKIFAIDHGIDQNSEFAPPRIQSFETFVSFKQKMKRRRSIFKASVLSMPPHLERHANYPTLELINRATFPVDACPKQAQTLRKLRAEMLNSCHSHFFVSRVWNSGRFCPRPGEQRNSVLRRYLEFGRRKGMLDGESHE